MINEPKIVEIKEIVTETPTIKTFKFDWDFETLGKPNPGEFVMVWNFKMKSQCPLVKSMMMNLPFQLKTSVSSHPSSMI